MKLNSRKERLRVKYSDDDTIIRSLISGCAGFMNGEWNMDLLLTHMSIVLEARGYKVAIPERQLQEKGE